MAPLFPLLPTEDRHGRGALQTWEWPHQGERTSPGDDRAAHAAIQGAGVGKGVERRPLEHKAMLKILETGKRV
jgi:hypothetical protein